MKILRAGLLAALVAIAAACVNDVPRAEGGPVGPTIGPRRTLPASSPSSIVDALGGSSSSSTSTSGFTVRRPTSRDDVKFLELAATAPVPSLVITADEHAAKHPPVLSLGKVGGETALILSFIAKPGETTPAIADTRTYAWGVERAPSLLVVRRVASSKAAFVAPAATGTLDASHVDAPSGAPVIVDPASVERGVDAIFAEIGAPKPASLGARALVLVAHPTASGRRARAVSVGTAGGRTVARAVLPVDAGADPWGPRGAGADVLTAPLGDTGEGEWILELE